MSRTDALLWQEAFDKEMSGLEKKAFSQWSIVLLIAILLAQPWSTNIILITSRILLLANVENRALYALAAAYNWHMFSPEVTQVFTYGKLDVPWFCHPPPGFDCPPGTVLGLKTLKYCLYGAKQAPARFKVVWFCPVQGQVRRHLQICSILNIQDISCVEYCPSPKLARQSTGNHVQVGASEIA
jgi:hypothetical protein